MVNLFFFLDSFFLVLPLLDPVKVIICHLHKQITVVDKLLACILIWATQARARTHTLL